MKLEKTTFYKFVAEPKSLSDIKAKKTLLSFFSFIFNAVTFFRVYSFVKKKINITKDPKTETVARNILKPISIKEDVMNIKKVLVTSDLTLLRKKMEKLSCLQNDQIKKNGYGVAQRIVSLAVYDELIIGMEDKISIFVKREEDDQYKYVSQNKFESLLTFTRSQIASMISYSKKLPQGFELSKHNEDLKFSGLVLFTESRSRKNFMIDARGSLKEVFESDIEDFKCELNELGYIETQAGDLQKMQSHLNHHFS